MGNRKAFRVRGTLRERHMRVDYGQKNDLEEASLVQ